MNTREVAETMRKVYTALEDAWELLSDLDDAGYVIEDTDRGRIFRELGLMTTATLKDVRALEKQVGGRLVRLSDMDTRWRWVAESDGGQVRLEPGQSIIIAAEGISVGVLNGDDSITVQGRG